MSFMCLFSGVIFLAIATHVMYRDSRYLRESTLIYGRIVDMHERKYTSNNGKGFVGYNPTVEYHAMGKKWQFEGGNQGPGHGLESGQSVAIRIQDGNYKIARLVRDIQGLSTIVYLFLPLGLMAVIAGATMFNVSDLSFSPQWFPVILGLAYVGIKVWPSLPFISSLSSIATFEESEEIVD